MANRDGRELLRGAEEETFDLFAQILTSEQWAELLRAPLKFAANQGNRGLVQKLIEAGAEIGDALHEATRGGHGHVVNDLLVNGACVVAKDTSRGWTPLHVAAQTGDVEMVQLLLLNGADKDAMDNQEFSPLYVAALNRRVAAALALMVAGADVSLRCGRYKMSVVQVAAQAGLVDIMRAAIEGGVNVHATDREQDTPLHAAALCNEMEATNMLLEAGANTEARNFDGCTPLHVAANKCSLEPVLALLRHGADVNAQDKYKETPLHRAAAWARKRGAVEVVDSLLRSSADETILNDEGKSAADVVAEGLPKEDQHAGDIDRVRELLANAPTDRAWRRRGYLVLCRAHPDRTQRKHERINSQAGMARRTRSGAKMGRVEASSCGGGVEASSFNGRGGGGDWAVVVARVVGLGEEGIFRTIVGYL